MTSNRTALEIVSDYYEDLERAFKTGELDLHINKMHFAEEIVLLCPNERFEGKKNVEEAYRDQLVPLVKRYELIHQYADKSSVCTIYDMISKRSITVPMVKWIKVKDGKIHEIQVFYDSVLWDRAMK